MQLVHNHKDTHGLNQCLEAAGVAKSSYYHWSDPPETDRRQFDRWLRDKLSEVIDDYPEYGRRRLLPELNERVEPHIGETKLRKLLSEHGLALKQATSPPPESGPRRIIKQAAGQLNKVAGRTFRPLRMVSGDFTEVPFDGGRRKAHLMAFVDPVSRWIPGWAIGPSDNTDLALKALDRLRTTYEKLGLDMDELTIHQDQDAVFTSYRWLYELLLEDGATVSYSENGARQNPWIESLWGRFSVEFLAHLRRAGSLPELKRTAEELIHFYLYDRRHSSIGNKNPYEHLKQIATEENLQVEHLSPN